MNTIYSVIALEHLAALYEVRNHNLAKNIILKSYPMYLVRNLGEDFQLAFICFLQASIDCLHLILNFFIINDFSLVEADHDFVYLQKIGGHIIIY